MKEEFDKLKEICLVQSEHIESLKRKNKRLENLIKYKDEELLKKLISILDDIYLVEDNEEISDGIKIIFNKLFKILEDSGLKPFNIDECKVFNDDLHNAIDIKYYKGIDEGYIDSIQRIGYRYKDKIIRHADVTVAKNLN